jgi:hypothetical protein
MCILGKTCKIFRLPVYLANHFLKYNMPQVNDYYTYVETFSSLFIPKKEEITGEWRK